MEDFMAVDAKLFAEILKAVPQQPPFRFIDEILEMDENRITGAYRFKEDEYFYAGHFPGNPITPGVILIEMMAQSGIVALGLYNIMLQKNVGVDQLGEVVSLFSSVEQVEFMRLVLPGERVIVHGEKIHYRRGIFKAKVSADGENGVPICSGILTGMAKIKE